MIEFKASQFFTADEVETFVKNYVDAMLWSTVDEEIYQDGKGPDTYLDANYGHDDVTDESMKDVLEECTDFMDSNQLKLKEVCARDGYSLQRAGHDFALTRNGHGAGFWDRGLGQAGDDLTKASKPYGESYWFAEGGEVRCD